MKTIRCCSRISSSTSRCATGCSRRRTSRRTPRTGCRSDRYRLYHVEKAKGGLGDDDDGRVGGRGRGQPAGVRQPARLHGRDRAVDPAHDRRDPRARRGVHDPAHPSRSPHGMGAGRLAAGASSASAVREPAHRNIPKEAEDWDIERIVGKYADAAERMQAGGMDGIEIEAYGHLFDQFLVADHEPPRPTSTAARTRTGCGSAGGCSRRSASGSGRSSSSACGWRSTRRVEGGIDMPIGLDLLRRLRGRPG